MQAFVDTVLHGIKVKNTVQGEVLVAKAIYKSMQAKKIREDNTWKFDWHWKQLMTA